MSLLAALLLIADAPPECTAPSCAVTMPPAAEFRFDNPALEVQRGRLRLDVTRRGQAAYAFQIALINAIGEARGKPLAAPEWVIARRNLAGAARASAELAASEGDIRALEVRAEDGGKGTPRDRAEVAETVRALRATLIGDAARFADAARRFAEAETAAR